MMGKCNDEFFHEVAEIPISQALLRNAIRINIHILICICSVKYACMSHSFERIRIQNILCLLVKLYILSHLGQRKII